MQSEVLDLLVVGAGATGTGTALDAAARGLSVGLIDKGDIAGGTSSRSSQLVHGGLRYLQQGNVALVRESLRERELLLTTLAPHVVRPLPFLLPLRHRVWERAYMGTGLMAYDLLARSGVLPRHRHRSRDEALERFPSLRRKTLVGAMEFYDAQMDDARLAVAIARTAAQRGAHVVPHAALVGSLGVGSDGCWRVSVLDGLTGEEFTVAARSVALCAGVWAPEASALFTGSQAGVSVMRSKGVHVRLPRTAIDGETALIIPTGPSVLFVLPTPTHWLVGTTDTAWPGRPDEVAPEAADVRYLLGLLNKALDTRITPDDVTYVFAGLRPLVRDQAVGGNTAKVTREHRIVRVAPGVLAIVGGKWTTYRVMARDLVDTVVSDAGFTAMPCTTREIPLVGSPSNNPPSSVIAGPGLGEPILGAARFIHADVIRAVLDEGACRLEDVLDRRLRVGLHLDEVTDVAVRDVAEVMGGLLSWSAAETQAAIEEYVSLIRA